MITAGRPRCGRPYRRRHADPVRRWIAAGARGSFGSPQPSPKSARRRRPRRSGPTLADRHRSEAKLTADRRPMPGTRSPTWATSSSILTVRLDRAAVRARLNATPVDDGRTVGRCAAAGRRHRHFGIARLAGADERAVSRRGEAPTPSAAQAAGATTAEDCGSQSPPRSQMASAVRGRHEAPSRNGRGTQECHAMIERSVTVVRVKDGLHARPATQFAKLAKTFTSRGQNRAATATEQRAPRARSN